MLRRVVTLESAVPLLVVAVLSIAVGFGGAALFLRAQLHYTLQPPGPGYYGGSPGYYGGPPPRRCAQWAYDYNGNRVCTAFY